jgi:alanine racemase
VSSGTRFRPTEAVVDLDAIRNNVSSLRTPGVRFMAVVKANGYGHGAIPVARAAVDAGAEWLGVALVEEGIALREGGLGVPILVLTEFPPGSEPEALAAGLTPTVYSHEGLERLAAASESAAVKPGVHVKVDTGMHRVGLAPSVLVAFLGRTRDAGFRLEGLWTHLATSERLDDPFADVQLDRFEEAVRRARHAGFEPELTHAANSAAALARPRSRRDLVRVGLAMYGLAPGSGLPGTSELRAAMAWRSAVSLVKRVGAGEGLSYGLAYRTGRDTTIATVPVGYADGYARLLSGRAEVLIGGRRHPVAGAVTMDQILVDCGDDLVSTGDEVVLMVRQGDEEIRADDLASWIGTINYEVVCAVSERVPRRYLGER